MAFSLRQCSLTQNGCSHLQHPTFDVWQLEHKEMLVLIEHMYHELGLVEEFGIERSTLKRWLLRVRDNYKSNPFHNFRHCFSVAQMMYGMIHVCRLKERLSREDLGVLLIGAVCHDLGHPGLTNAYLINAKTELAVVYGEVSPLESHHCAVTFKILEDPQANIFANVPQERYRRLRSELTALIMATDMARHAEVTARLGDCIKEGFDFQKKCHTDVLKMALLKCCDLSNEVRPNNISQPLLDCLLEEYFNQADREKAEGLPVVPFMDREKATKPMVQLGFISFVILPLFELVAKIFPEILPTMVEPLRSAKSRYEALELHEDVRRKQVADTSQTKSPILIK